MRCLFVSPEPLTERSGGGIAMLQSIIAISCFSEVDILAPEGSILNTNRPNIKIGD